MELCLCEFNKVIRKKLHKNTPSFIKELEWDHTQNGFFDHGEEGQVIPDKRNDLLCLKSIEVEEIWESQLDVWGFLFKLILIFKILI